MKTTALALMLGVMPMTSSANNTALILGTEQYESQERVSRGGEVVDSSDGIGELGFHVISLKNGRTDTTTEALLDFLQLADGAERLIVALSGRFATDGERTWYMTTDAVGTGIFTVALNSVSVESLLAVLADARRGAVLLLGVEKDSDAAFDGWLREGIGHIEIPQGVIVLTGEPQDIANFLSFELAEPGGDLSLLVGQNENIYADGYLPQGFVFMPEDVPIVVVPRPESLDIAVEFALWERAVAVDTVRAFRDYLGAYPVGQFANAAENAIESLIAEPHRNARQVEDALNLTRNQREDIQRNLTFLNFETGSIDGSFEGTSRTAITGWQQQNGFDQTGFLTAAQITRLDVQAGRRAAQLEIEASEQQQIAAQADRSVWDETGARGDEDGLRAYLDSYPNGLFAETATEQLGVLELAKRQQFQEADRAAWITARSTDTILAYRTYLRENPEGAFRTEAQEQVASMVGQVEATATIETARADEQALGLTRQTARLVEARLDQLGLEPGEIDCTFDSNARQAIRGYQRNNNLPVTGYLNEDTVLRMLTGSRDN